MNKDHQILELYSGIGGMHCAWKASGLLGKIAAAVDINTVANEVYRYNFRDTKVNCRNIQSVSLEEYRELNADTILMSPPCQPFTRNGKYLDHNDERTKSFLYLLNILNDLDVTYILLENVKGFETSEVHDLFIKTLKSCRFEYQEFLLCPTSVGVPNSRLRYYCIARKCDTGWNFNRTENQIMESLPNNYEPPYKLSEIMEPTVDDKFLIPKKFLRRAKVFDICYNNSQRSCCFTKAYTHYMEGMGSVFTECNPEFVAKCYENANSCEIGGEQFVEALLPLKLRYFTPKEVLALMSFPKNYSFPENITLKQCYRLLGNSVNVKVISELLNLLYL